MSVVVATAAETETLLSRRLFQECLRTLPGLVRAPRIKKIYAPGSKNPLLDAARLLLRKRGKIVLATGFPVGIAGSGVRKLPSGRLGFESVQFETDGTDGAIFLASVLRRGLGRSVTILSETGNHKFLKISREIYGLGPSSCPIVDCAPESLAPERDVAVFIEKPGKNSEGVIHTASGYDVTPHCLDLDGFLRRMKQCSIGIGDGGNEIGMGCLAGLVRQRVPHGTLCLCGCGGGIACVQKTRTLVPCTVSNIACYCLGGLLSILSQDFDSSIIPKGAVVRKSIQSISRAGSVDGILGKSRPAGVDGVRAGEYEKFVDKRIIRLIKRHDDATAAD